MLSLDLLFSEHAVLQRGKELRIWGRGEDGRTVQVLIQGQKAEAIVRGGKWEAVLPPLKASGQEELKASDGMETLVIENIAVGEVWIAGGQSNMEFPLRNLREFDDIKNTDVPQIRLFCVPKLSYEGQLDDDDFSEYRFWRPCSPGNLWYYSAAPFYFAMRLFEKYHVPVGIINCNYGGTRASSWADLSILEKTGAKIWIDEYEEGIKGLDIEKYSRLFRMNPAIKAKIQNHSALYDKVWKGYSRFDMLLLRTAREILTHVKPLIGPMDPNRPSALYENMVKTIAPYTARGVIWYQGESDDPHPEVYDEAMGAVLDSWRKLWDDSLAFLMVQLAPYEGAHVLLPAMNFGKLRLQQEKVSKTREKVYITNVMDAGMREDIHPKDKRTVGERLALLAMGKIYGEGILCEAPQIASIHRSGDQITLEFMNCGKGLSKHNKDVESLEVEVDGKSIDDFKVRVKGISIKFECPAFRNGRKTSIRYGLCNYCECNIKNSAGIPVKPFEIVL